MSMPNQRTEKKKISFEVILPDKPAQKIICDDVRITVKDSKSGKGGGLYGILPGHAPAVFLLDSGITEAFSDGKSIWKQKTGEGFARVENGTVTFVTEFVE